MQVKDLTGVSFDMIYRTFREAFEDYVADVSYMDKNKLQNRAIKNGFDPRLSAGAFDDDHLVGFTLVGIDKQFIRPSAFDIMTGIVPGHRGKGLAGQMFRHIQSNLTSAGIERFFLEVIRENDPAVKAYKKMGFKISRSVNCYELNTALFQPADKLRLPVKFNEESRDVITQYETYTDWFPSWENSFSSIQRIPDDVIVISATYSIKKIGLIVYYPPLKWIMALLVNPVYRNMGIGSALLELLIQRLEAKTENIRFMNVPEDDHALVEFLTRSGFQFIAGQYEMVLDLNHT